MIARFKQWRRQRKAWRDLAIAKKAYVQSFECEDFKRRRAAALKARGS